MCWLMWDVSHTTFGGGRFSTASRESKNLLLFISRTRGLLAWSKNCSFRCCPRQGHSCFAVRAVPRPVIAISTNPIWNTAGRLVLRPAKSPGAYLPGARLSGQKGPSVGTQVYYFWHFQEKKLEV